MVSTAAIDLREFARFVLTGLTATAVNVAVVWLACLAVRFEIALLAGIFAALAFSFTLTKLFAFRSHSWMVAGVEGARFLVVYALSCVLYFSVAVASEHHAIEYGVAAETAKIGGVLLGAATMMVTSYIGHRFFTYRTYQQARERLRGGS